MRIYSLNNRGRKFDWVQGIEIILQDLPGLVSGSGHRDNITGFTRFCLGFRT